VLKQYYEKQEQIKQGERREQDEQKALEKEFKNVFSSIVQPSMKQMAKYLESKWDEFKGSYVKTFLCEDQSSFSKNDANY